MNLAIDIGNTRAKLGWFEEDHLVDKKVVDATEAEKIKSWITNHPPQNVILSNVSAIPPSEWLRYLDEQCFFVHLTASTPVPIINEYRTPETLGRDRLAAVVGANHLFPKKTCLVIDAGTCMTYDVITSKGHYR